MRWECSVVADLLRWLSDQNLDWFEAVGQRTQSLYMEITSILSMDHSAVRSVILSQVVSKQV